MSHEHQQAIAAVLRDQPLASRLAHLLYSVTVDDDPVLSIELMIELTLVAARRLPPAQQTAIRWHLSNALSELETVWQ